MDIALLTGWGLLTVAVAVLTTVIKCIPAVRTRSKWLAPLIAVGLGGLLGAAVIGATGENFLRGLICGAVAAWGYDVVVGLVGRLRSGPLPAKGMGDP